jgi:hypothetical protein
VPGRVDGMAIGVTPLFYAKDGKLVRGEGRVPRPDLFARRGIDLDVVLADEQDESPPERPSGDSDGTDDPVASAGSGG